jgi:hypothetical protein
MPTHLSQIAAAFAFLIAPMSAGYAASLTQVKGEPILEIVGNIENTNASGVAAFDREALEALGVETITTTTPWHNGSVRFEGVSLAKLMALVGAKGKTVRAIALNDYTTTIPLDDFARFGTILALKRDGQYMAVREKGPLFVIYPYDRDPSLKSQMYYARSAWQVKRLEVLQ